MTIVAWLTIVLIALVASASWLYYRLEIENRTEGLTRFWQRLLIFLYKLKTDAFGAFLSLLGLATAVDPYLASQVLGPQSLPWIVLASGIAVWLYHRLTKDKE